MSSDVHLMSFRFDRPQAGPRRQIKNVTDVAAIFRLRAPMQLSGYANTELAIEKVVSAELAEVTLCATPGELRRMAEFFLFCASEMERMGSEYSHVHLADRMKEFKASPHLTVFRSF